jgi:hypothetical protein
MAEEATPFFSVRSMDCAMSGNQRDCPAGGRNAHLLGTIYENGGDPFRPVSSTTNGMRHSKSSTLGSGTVPVNVWERPCQTMFRPSSSSDSEEQGFGSCAPAPGLIPDRMISPKYRESQDVPVWKRRIESGRIEGCCGRVEASGSCRHGRLRTTAGEGAWSSKSCSCS